MIDLDKLEALAKAATPGPWFYQDASDAYTHIVRPVDNPGRIIASGTQTSDARGETTGRFIAAANPATVLEMITLIRELAVVSIPVIKEGAKIEGGEPINAQKIRDALRKAYNTGQSYFHLADREFTSHHRKADALAAKFAEFIEEQVVLLSATAPVADTAPQWISVDTRLPAVGDLVLVFYPRQPHDWPGTLHIELDCIDPNDDDSASWLGHKEHYEHYCCLAKPEGSSGPSEKAPYTHWCAIPAAPAPTKEGSDQ